jgi:hypothetical protein
VRKIASMALKTGAAVILAVPTVLIATSASAAPVTTGTATARPTATVSPQAVGSCTYSAIPPQQPLYHGPVYATTGINSCKGDVELCHLAVDLQKLEPQGYYVTVGHADRGWAACSGSILKSSAYKCPGGYSSTEFITLATLTVEGSGGPGAPDAVYSDPDHLACT